jgi:hypothetical protein
MGDHSRMVYDCGMAGLFDKAIEAARKLPADEREALGAIILEEIADEARWAKTFAESQEVLDRLAEEALDELRAGRTEPLDLTRRK